MAYTWNLVTKNFNLSPVLRAKIDQKLIKLERHIQHFPEDAVHLQIVISRLPKRTQYQAGLTLRLPSNPLHSEKTALDPIPAFDNAFKALLREISTLKADLRGEKAWKQKGRRSRLQAEKPLRFAAPTPPARPALDFVMAQFEREQPRLLHYLQRQLWRAQVESGVSPDAIEPQEVLDEVARQLESGEDSRSPDHSTRIWFYHLVRSEMNRQIQSLLTQRREEVSLDGRSAPSDSADRTPVPPGEEPADPFEQQFEAGRDFSADRIVDASAIPPDETAAHHELLDLLHAQAGTWPAPERTLFELHFLEGFDLDEVAMLERRKVKELEALRDAVQERLRNLLRTATEIAALRPRPAPLLKKRANRGKKAART